MGWEQLLAATAITATLAAVTACLAAVAAKSEAKRATDAFGAVHSRLLDLENARFAELLRMGSGDAVDGAPGQRREG